MLSASGVSVGLSIWNSTYEGEQAARARAAANGNSRVFIGNIGNRP